MKEKIKNNTILKFIENHEQGFFLAIVLFFCSIYYISYSIHNIPYTQGWGNAYADLVFSGKFPYRDFYFYIPPLNLIIDCIFWKLSFGHLIVYVVFRFIERMIIIWLTYRLLCKLTKPRYASIGTIIGAFLLAATVYDVIGDYNQTTLLLTIVLTNIYNKYIEIANSMEANKKEYRYLFVGGLIIGLSFLHKQTIFLAQCIVFFAILTTYFIINRKKYYIKSVLITLAGIIIPIAIALLILAINGAVFQFLDQVYLNVDAKGSLISMLTAIVIWCLKWKYLILSTVITIYIYCSKYFIKMKENNQEYKILKYFVKSVLLLIIYVIILTMFIETKNNIKVILETGFTVFAVISILVIMAIDFILEKYGYKNSKVIYILISTLMFACMAIMYINKKYAKYLYRYTILFAILTDFSTIITIGTIILICYLFYSYSKNKDISLLKWIIALAGGMAFEYNGTMASGLELVNYCTMLSYAVLITYLLSKVCSKDRIMKIIILIICIFISSTCMSQKVMRAYSWWGWYDTEIGTSKFYTIDVPGLEGYRTSLNIKYMYEEMYKVIKSNTNEESVIYGFPHVRIFNVILNNSNMNHFVPVPFYDVCSDDYMREDIKILKENPPEIIIWVDIPGCMETHEEVFRDERPLEQRKFQEWLYECVNEGKYTLIGQYDSLFVYKLNDGTEINYTYYKNPDAVNYTLIPDKEKDAVDRLFS